MIDAKNISDLFESEPVSGDTLLCAAIGVQAALTCKDWPRARKELEAARLAVAGILEEMDYAALDQR